MHIRYNANIDNKTYVGERDLQKVIRCFLTYGNQFIRHNWKPFSSKFWNSNSTEFYTILKLSALMIPMVPLNNKKRFHDTSSPMEFHGTSSAPISMTRAVPWNSMEFHGTWSAPISLTEAVSHKIFYHGINFFCVQYNKPCHRKLCLWKC